MSVIAVQCGHCGNLLGKEFYKTAYEDIRGSNEHDDSLSKWFDRNSRGDLSPRAVCVDSSELIKQEVNVTGRSTWCYDRCSCMTLPMGGLCNNWAMGYQNGASLSGGTLDRVRVLLERCDEVPEGLLIFHSATGGTGAGFTSYLVRELRDEHPKAAICAISVLPFRKCGVSPQAYNVMLSLSSMYSDVDAVLPLSNEYINELCTTLLKNCKVGMSDINRVMAEQVWCSLGPFDLTELLSHMVPNDEFKLLSARSAPHVSSSLAPFEPVVSWERVMAQLRLSLARGESHLELRGPPITDSNDGACHRSLALSLTARGPLDGCTLSSGFAQPSLYSLLSPSSPNFLHSSSPHKFQKRAKFACLLSNSALPAAELEVIANNARSMFSHKAYLHHYSKHGLSNNDFSVHMTEFEDILKQYNNM